MTPEAHDWNLTRDEFADALRKGLGRALLHVRQHGAADRLDLIIDACRTDQRYDSQCEHDRFEYLSDLVGAFGQSDLVRDRLIKFVREPDEGREIWNALGVLAWMARCGDAAALAVVRERFDADATRGCADSGDEMIMTEPIEGLLHVARAFGNNFTPDERWRPASWFDTARKLDGEMAVKGALSSAGKSDPSVAAFLDLATQPRDVLYDAPAEAKVEPGSLPDILTFVFDPDDPPKNFDGARARARRWSYRASSEQRNAAAHAVVSENDSERLAVLCNVFCYPRNRFPLDIAPLIEKARVASDERGRYYLLRVLNPFSDKRVRELAIELLERHGPDSDIVELFIENYEAGDGALLMKSINARPLDAFEREFDDLHGVVLAISKIFEDPSRTDGGDLLLWAYEHTPCSLCRQYIVKSLIRLGAAPDWLLQECLCDGVDDIRKIAAKAIAGESIDDK